MTMNPSLLFVTPSSSSAVGATSPALLSPFLIRSTPSYLFLPSRRRLRVSFPHNSAASTITAKPSDESTKRHRDRHHRGEGGLEPCFLQKTKGLRWTLKERERKMRNRRGFGGGG
ncbi:hypothetical protein LINPERHAP1_LOCUS17107 [Linum perenne]